MRVLRDVGYQVEWALEKGIAAAERGQRLEPGSSGPPSNLSQLHADRAELLAQRELTVEQRKLLDEYRQETGRQGPA